MIESAAAKGQATADIPDAGMYRPLYSPWLTGGDPAFRAIYEPIRPFSLVSSDRCYVLYSLARQAAQLAGEWWECGVYKGGTAMLLGSLIEQIRPPSPIRLRLFDTFVGMPQTDPERDLHQQGDFADTDEQSVRSRVPYAFASLHKGLIPESFTGLESARIALAHIDVDIYSSITSCCEFIYPRMLGGGFMVFDDYGFPTCPGARQAVDEFFAERREVPLVLPTGQSVAFIGTRKD
jgi:O-methyltransferase